MANEKRDGVEIAPSEKLDRNSRVPLYHQLFMLIRSDIMDGTLKHGDFLPTESELEEAYGVSRITVRKAIDSLVNHNLVSRRQGRGTVVLRPTVLDDFGKLFPVPPGATVHTTDEGDVSIKVLSTDFAPASDLTAQQLNVDVGEELGILKYLRIVNGQPQCLEDIAFVLRLCPDIFVKHDLNNVSFYHVLEQEYDIRLVRAVHTVSVAIPTAPRITKWLQLEAEQPVLFVERTSYTQHGIPFEHVRTYYRSDLYSLRFESTRPNQEGGRGFVTPVEQAGTGGSSN